MGRPIREVQATYECVPNIGQRGRRRRFTMAAVCFTAGVAAAAWLQLRGAPVLWRLGLAAPFVAATLYYFQAREKT